jgi:uncharacterized protein YfdQ (DUF2303 family)
MDQQPFKTELEAALEAGKELMKPEVIDVNGIPTLVVHKSAQVSSFPERTEAPQALIQNVILHDATSFLEYFNEFADDHSYIFVDLKTAKFKAIIDYHKDSSSPRWNRHTVTYQCPKTPEWSKWIENSGSKMDQVEFALFIEDNLAEIAKPTGAEMLEIASSLQSKNNASFSSATRLDNGETQFNYKEDIETSAGVNGQLNIPAKIELGLAPFQGTDAYKVEARFRYRVSHGTLTMWYDIIRSHRIIEDAVKDTFEAIKKGKKGGFILMGDCPV